MRRAGAITCALAAVVLGAAPAGAHSYRVGAIAIGHVWSGPAVAGATGLGVYGPLLNTGAAADRLTGASTPVATRVRFRIKQAGKVKWLDAIDVPPGRPVTLAPWRSHLWLTGLKRALKAGQRFPLTLIFRHAGRITIDVVVGREGAH